MKTRLLIGMRDMDKHKKIVRMTAKEKHRINLLIYLGDPENDFPKRQGYAEILNVTVSTLYGHFSPDDFLELEKESCELRKKNSARQRTNLMKALYIEGKGGNISAIKEFLDRTEGKVVEKIEQTNKYPKEIILRYIKASTKG